MFYFCGFWNLLRDIVDLETIAGARALVPDCGAVGYMPVTDLCLISTLLYAGRASYYPRGSRLARREFIGFIFGWIRLTFTI